MSFGKKNGVRLEDMNFEKLTNSQLWVLADYLGCRNDIYSCTEQNRREILKKRCLDNPIKAQLGVDVIVWKKEPVNSETATAKSLIEILNSYSKQLEDLSTIRLDGTMAKAKKIFAETAEKALAEACEKARPIEIRQAGKEPKKVKGVLPPEFERMLQLASQRIPILLVGPAGCGKTYLAAKLAEALEMEFSDQSCSEGMSESVFNGLLLPIGKNGEFKHVQSPFLDRYETGGVFLLDEIDAGDANLFTYINKAIANDSFTVAQRFHKPLVKKSSDFVLVAAANTFGHGADAMYCGRNQLDAATLDRFRVGLICLDYSQKVEKTLAMDNLCGWAWEIREKIRKHKLHRVMSTRVIEQLGKMQREYGWQREEWEQAYFAGWPENERRLVA